MKTLARPLLLLWAIASAAAEPTAPGPDLPKVSPFLPPPAPAAPQPPPYPLQLAGVSSAVGKTLVCIYDLRVRRTAWVAVGDSLGPLLVVSYDDAEQSAVIALNGVRHTLLLRSSSVTPGQAAPPSDPAEIKRRQDAARMLVSDLLDIGMEQRRAFDAARHKAEKAAPAAP